MSIGPQYSNLFFILFTCSTNYNDVVCCVSWSEAWSVCLMGSLQWVCCRFQRCHLLELLDKDAGQGSLYCFFWISEQRSKDKTCRTESKTCHKQVVLEGLCDINTVCSHCCLMVQVHVTCMFVTVEVMRASVPAGVARAPPSLVPFYAPRALGWITSCAWVQIWKTFARGLFVTNIFHKS
jgi:hypothetical protein